MIDDPASFDLPQVPDGPLEVSVDSKGKEIAAHESVARQVADLLKAGIGIHEAEKQAHVQVTGPKANQQVRERLEQILKYEMPADERRRTVRARLNEVLIEGDFDQAVKAAKLIADDPEVNISQQPPGVSVQIDFSKATLELFQQVEDEERPPK